ncbi:LysR family transcriptional regulator [Legionella taurinensis]|uniref:LysR family transcriptional regulator n=1 Tax=Legionella taurinensis TaxID=70611 RepID=A0A3A5LHT0_9GAMM|nr:LysR family transcriptional regulator [Legionella taurinensis]MDX1838388.1 LysR family transcriptional regulator [Legionella taurinensis]PUT39147.1 LysR family transcriptional regulator [Legionella taurinensis]PUT39772.1 LysR family transcriptional regulator [Legionella taurinensis]PUT43603.1 LysR family transcriptional regulator [Legionella taurinensis]PUT45259.1 LysR family transcriptional regulator [Legionella taurinensis]
MAKITLEQWRVLQAVADEGTFAKAGEKLHKSQSSISYTVGKLQDILGIRLFDLQGRKAVLTEQGLHILNSSRQLTRAARNLEQSVHQFKSNHEKTLRLAVDEIFPPNRLLQVLKAFGLQNTHTRIILNQGLLSGPSDALEQGEAEMVIVSRIPEGYMGEKLMDINSIPYAHIDSPLHQKNIGLEELCEERYIIVQDSGRHKKRNEGWLGSEFHWKVSSMEMKIQCVAHGIGFSWLPEALVEGRNLPIKPLRLPQDNVRTYPLYLVHHNPQNMGPSARVLTDLFRQYSQSPVP